MRKESEGHLFLADYGLMVFLSRQVNAQITPTHGIEVRGQFCERFLLARCIIKHRLAPIRVPATMRARYREEYAVRTRNVHRHGNHLAVCDLLGRNCLKRLRLCSGRKRIRERALMELVQFGHGFTEYIDWHFFCKSTDVE